MALRLNVVDLGLVKIETEAETLTSPRIGRIQFRRDTFDIPDPNSNTLDVQFNDLIAKTHQLQFELNDKLNEYRCKLQLEQNERSVLNATLQREVEKNESMYVENVKLNSELQRCNNNVNSLRDDLKRKESELSDLSKQCQKYREEKASFNDLLKSFMSRISFSDADNSLTPVDRSHDNDCADVSVQLMNQKRPRDIDSDPLSSTCEENSTTKREKIADSNDDESYVPDDESVESDSDDEMSSESTRKIDEEAESDASEVMAIDNVHNESADSDVECSASCSTNFAAKNNEAVVELWVGPISSKQRKTRRNINKVMDFENLTAETKIAYQQEKDRRRQYCRRLQKYSETYGALPGELNTIDTLVLDFDFDTKAELLAVDRRLSVKLKPHQCDGVKFMWDACFESIEKLRHSHGSGCILSHCMGLGKTLQVITLVHTLLTHSAETKVRKVLIICPVNVILNWVDEFDMWLKEFRKEEQIQIYELATCNPGERVNRLKSWHQTGGVFIIGYRLFQTMYGYIHQMASTKSNSAESKILYDAFIDPGADLVVCDEGHLLKNPTSQLSLALNKIRTLRRIVLTGTPLQNNLNEYFSMIEFVKPRLLGTEREFNNRFVGPILNGQFADSTEDDIKLMTYRAYVLHKLLGGCVHRRDYSVLAKFLPPKQEYVLFIRLTQQQIDLYKLYMVNFADTNAVADLPYLKRICNHPKVLAESEDRCKKKPANARMYKIGGKALDKNGGWWRTVCSDCDQLELSNKMSILLAILSECEARDEKLIVFSGCLGTLNVIEHFLAKITERTRHSNPSPTEFKGFWLRELDYYRLDGTQSAEKRKRDVTQFNNETNIRTRLFLISTKAGGVGINLMAANRVVIFDASWNPSDDIQSIFRTYRIGQKKACYIYRFISLGTMEEKIYDRQVTKLSISKRVIDEHTIHSHYNEEDLQQLHCVNNLDPPAQRQAHGSTDDNLLNWILRKYPDAIYKQHDHDSLLQNVSDEPSTDEEVVDFWEDSD